LLNLGSYKTSPAGWKGTEFIPLPRTTKKMHQIYEKKFSRLWILGTEEQPSLRDGKQMGERALWSPQVPIWRVSKREI
jgi:hypothetical protein